jgi:hypothetical protein
MIHTGLTIATEAELAAFDECMANAVPFSLIHENKDDTKKFIEWDSSFEEFCEHRRKLIDNEGRNGLFPWQIYDRFALKWMSGFGTSQGSKGSCCAFGHGNSLNASNLTNWIFSGKPAPDIFFSEIYALAKGNGKPVWGDGLNLSVISKWAAEVGNFLSSDYGEYTATGKYIDRPSETKKANALKHQSIIIPLPDTKFSTVYSVAAAGIGINIGSSRYFTTAAVDQNGIAVGKGITSGGHSEAVTAALEKNNTRYVFIQNSHGSRYKGDLYGNTTGYWVTESGWNTLNVDQRYGKIYANVGEL